MTIFKYLIEPGDKLGLEMPRGAVMLSVEIIDDQPYLYAAVDEKAPKVTKHFRLVPTGTPVEEKIFPRGYPWGHQSYEHGLAHVATFQIKHEGVRPLVFHLFEVIGQ